MASVFQYGIGWQNLHMNRNRHNIAYLSENSFGKDQ